MSKRRKDTKKTVGRGYVGRWNDGTLGWSMPVFLQPGFRSADRPAGEATRPWAQHEPHYLCEITVKLVTDKLGRPRVVYPGGKRKKP